MTMQTSLMRAAAFVVALLPALAMAQAGPDAPPDGFSLKHEAVIDAPRVEVYRILTERVGYWWNPQHTFTGDAANLSIDARPGGCFCESFPEGGGAEHLRVVHVAPERMLRLSGGLGPLQAFGVAGSLTWKLEEADGSTWVEVTYVVGGFMEGGLERIGGPVGAVIGEQLGRLKLYVETGEPTTDAQQP